MKIMVAYDGSEGANAAIADLRLAGLPENTDAIVMTVADVWPGLLNPPSPDDPNRELFKRAHERAAEAMLHAREVSLHGADFIRSLFPAWQVRAEAVADSPYWAFVTKADELRADLIVVGSRGLTAARRFALGSVSQNVLHYARCAVRVARHSRGTREDGPAKVLLGFDGSVGAADAVASIRHRKWPDGSQVRIVAALDDRTCFFMLADADVSSTLPRVTPDDNERTYMSRTIDAIGSQLQRDGLMVTTIVKKGDPKRALIGEARKWGADCIFVGARGLSRIERILIGSVSASVAARAHCSVEVVRTHRPH